MKTAISIPDDTFDRATRRAAELGLSRSEFFTRAVRRYIGELEDASLTREIDSFLDHLDSPDESAVHAVSAGRHTLASGADEW